MKITDPLERLIANGLGAAHIPYIHASDDAEVCRGASFYLTRHGIYLDVQPYTLPGTGRVLARVANCILIQGNQAAYVFLDLIGGKRPTPSYIEEPPVPNEAQAKEAKLTDVQFLLARLADLDFSQDMDGFIRDWLGHVEPALSRLRKAVSEAEQPKPQGG